MPAVAAKICRIKNIVGPGIGNQKKWLTVKNFLKQEDWNLSYSEQSQKILSINSISLKEVYPNIKIFGARPAVWPGIEGLKPTLEIIKYTKKIAVANKESIICGWNLINKKLKFYIYLE